jgi:hypothetical protein
VGVEILWLDELAPVELNAKPRLKKRFFAD